MGLDIVVCTTRSIVNLDDKFLNNVIVEEIDIDYYKKINIIKSF